jgi:hypothetical protein
MVFLKPKKSNKNDAKVQFKLYNLTNFKTEFIFLNHYLFKFRARFIVVWDIVF